MDSDKPPLIPIRWLRPQGSSAYLDLPSAPITATNSRDTSWQAFTAEESAACESAWQALTEEEKERAEPQLKIDDIEPVLEVEEDDDDEKVGVSIATDKLFEVNVKTMRLQPTYWRLNAPPIVVMRATWMYDEHHPVPRELASRLEEAYVRVKPWQSAYQLELSTAFELGPEAHAKLKQPLDDVSSMLFQDESNARVISNTVAHRFFSSFRASPAVYSSRASPTAFYPGSTVVYRGYNAAVAAKGSPQGQVADLNKQISGGNRGGLGEDSETIEVTPALEETEVMEADEAKRRGRSKEWEQALPSVGNRGREEVTDLILIIHGIGQGLAAQYEHLNFVYAANLFRKQSMEPALASIMRNRRVQFLPVQWRTDFNVGEDEETERKKNGLDNDFTLADITLRDNVVYIRELMNNVLIDIPYFMSHHRQRMIESVAKQANRIYRLWCARNPEFEHKGRVHVIAHSLGSALAAHILSNQPTQQPPLSKMDEAFMKGCTDLFLFNTSHLFLVGSPLPVFLHIHRSQVIARKGRERTLKSPPDEALDKVGTFGCLAVDSIFNVFNPSDPIAYMLNPCVDSSKAKELPPSAIRNTNSALFSTFSTRVSRLFDGIANPFQSTHTKSRSPSRPTTSTRAFSAYDLGGQSERLEGTRAERRFTALNPHGTLDFCLPTEGIVSEYVDMLTAHSSYWADQNFAAFILAEIFAKKEDLARTGLGLERPDTRSN